MGALPSAAQSLRKDLTEGMSEHSPPAELFLRAYEVFSHPRCANCHPADDRPRWGAPVHGMNVQRGWEQLSNGGDVLPGGYGRPGMPCETCHQSANGALPGSPPGAQNWRLAPSSMGWSGLTAHELCTRLTLAGRKDGGQQAVDALAHILTPGKVDPLVAWAWEPGLGRDPAPGTLDQFIEILRWWKWVGAACPERGG
jgi:hypothetical protein